MILNMEQLNSFNWTEMKLTICNLKEKCDSSIYFKYHHGSQKLLLINKFGFLLRPSILPEYVDFL